MPGAQKKARAFLRGLFNLETLRRWRSDFAAALLAVTHCVSSFGLDGLTVRRARAGGHVADVGAFTTLCQHAVTRGLQVFAVHRIAAQLRVGAGNGGTGAVADFTGGSE